MALSDPIINFGIHNITAYARTARTIGSTAYAAGAVFGPPFKVIGDANFTMNTSSVQLYGGSSYYPWASEITSIDQEVSVTLKQYPNALYNLFAGGSITETAASATGTVTTLQNSSGTSVVDASTGIASVGLKSGETSELKYGWYVVKAVSSTTVDVYAYTDLDFNNGTAISYQDDDAKITSSALTISTGAAVEVPNTGVELTGGSGTIGMTTGDLAIYHVTPAHGGINSIDLGTEGVTFPEIGLFLVGKTRSSGQKMSIQIFKAQAVSGISIPLLEGDFATSEVTLKALLDSNPIDGSGTAKVATITQVLPA